MQRLQDVDIRISSSFTLEGYMFNFVNSQDMTALVQPGVPAFAACSGVWANHVCIEKTKEALPRNQRPPPFELLEMPTSLSFWQFPIQVNRAP